MMQLSEILLSNALFIIPAVLVVSMASRYLKRPVVVHCLWLIVLLKLLTPLGVELSWPGRDRVASLIQPVTQPFARDRAKPKAETRSNTQLVTSNQRNPAPATGAKSNDSTTSNASKSAPAQPQAASERNSTTWPWEASSLRIPRNVLLGAWLLGSLSFVSILLFRARRFHQFVVRAPLADPSVQSVAGSIAKRYQLSRTPTVRVATGDFPPLLWVSPQDASIVLPSDFLSQLDSTSTRNVLAHELAHFARGDHWVRVVESVVLAAYWWHPLVWWARRQLQHAEEQCCDAWVLWAYPKSSTDYARTLLATLDYLSTANPALPPLASGLGRSNLIRRRFEMILHHKSPRRLTGWGMAAALLTAFAILPWSTSVFADATDPDATETAVDVDKLQREIKTKISKQLKESKRNIEKAKNLQIRKAKAAKAKAEEQKEAAQQMLRKRIENDTIDKDTLRRQIKTIIRQTLKNGFPKSDEMEISGDLDWISQLTGSLSVLDRISEDEVKAIQKHVEDGMEELGAAIEKSAHAFAKAMEAEAVKVEEAVRVNVADAATALADVAADVEVEVQVEAAKPMKSVTDALAVVEETLQRVEDVRVKIDVKADEISGRNPEMAKEVKARAKRIKKSASVQNPAKGSITSKAKNTGRRNAKELDALLKKIEALVEELEAKADAIGQE